jgi:tetratricopeptide (TPR) repeat protein
MPHDLNVLQRRAEELVKAGRPEAALRLYFFMADGDPSLDGGYLGEKIAECYESMGLLYAAKYWYGRAVEENPQVRLASAAAKKRLEAIVTIDDLVTSAEYVTSARRPAKAK